VELSSQSDICRCRPPDARRFTEKAKWRALSSRKRLMRSNNGLLRRACNKSGLRRQDLIQLARVSVRRVPVVGISRGHLGCFDAAEPEWRLNATA
jgi:hypothetical protein